MATNNPWNNAWNALTPGKSSTSKNNTNNKNSNNSSQTGWSGAWNALLDGTSSSNKQNNTSDNSMPSNTGTDYFSSASGGSSGSGSSGSGSSYSYNDGDITDRERLAAQNQQALASYNADTVRNQLAQQLANYDMADKQNRRLADVQRIQNSRRTEADRFEAMRDLQNASLGLFGLMNQAMNGSTVGNVMRMLENRNDKDNMNYWTQLQQNQNAVENAYDESVNQNNLARNEAISTAEATLRGMEADLAANLNNINPNLYVAPGTAGTTNEDGTSTDGTDLGSAGLYDAQRVAANNARLSGYLMPDNSVNNARRLAARNRLNGSNYFNRLVNGFNGR